MLAITTSIQNYIEVLVNAANIVNKEVMKIEKEETNVSLFSENFKEPKIHFIKSSAMLLEQINTEKSEGK